MSFAVDGCPGVMVFQRRAVRVRRVERADVAQLVEHHLAKVRVAGSSPVIRSQSGIHTIPLGVVGWPRGEAAACKAVYTGSNPVPTSGDWRRGSALPSHGRGHWFDPSIAHGNLETLARISICD